MVRAQMIVPTREGALCRKRPFRNLFWIGGASGARTTSPFAPFSAPISKTLVFEIAFCARPIYW